MADQAQSLRLLADQARQHSFEIVQASVVTRAKPARTIAVTSGKGGVGKTSFTTNLGLLLARHALRVIVLDADLGLANLHVVLGISPQYDIEHVLHGEKTLRDILCMGPEGMQIVPGASGIAELANLDADSRQRFVDSLAELDNLADIVLVDTGAGLSDNVLAFVLAVDEVVVVTTPEPTAIADAYAVIKVISQKNPEARMHIVVNQVTTDLEARSVSERLQLVTRQFLNAELNFLGALPQDPAVPRAVRAQRPLLLEAPAAPATKAIARIAAQLAPESVPSTGADGLFRRMARFLRSRGT